MTSEQVPVVIVTYNSAHDIADCIDELRASPRLKVIAIDNASSDDTVGRLKELLPAEQVLINHDNVGFAAAVNSASAGLSESAIVLMNPDAQIDAKDLERLVDVVQSGIADVAGPDIVTGLAVASGGRMPTCWRMFCHYFGISRLAGAIRPFQGHYLLRRHLTPGARTSVDWVTGACMVVRGSLWRELGGLSERWFMYAEDIEFCYRAGRVGARIVLAGDVQASHRVAGSQRDDVLPRADWIVNLYDFYARDLSRRGVDRFMWVAIVSSGFWLRVIAFRIGQMVTRDAQYVKRAKAFAHYGEALRRAAWGGVATSQRET